MTNDLRSIIESARDEAGGSLKDFTVLSAQIDPYRLDTPANHEVGKWFADQMGRLNLLHRRLHLRGIHYALLGSTVTPSGLPYTNTGENWSWLQESAAKAARWLGYVPFDAITDARNEEPVIQLHDRMAVSSFVSVEPHITFPDLESIEPRVGLFGFEGRQPYRRALCITRKVKTEFGNFYVHLDLGPDGRPIGVSPLVSGKRSACGSPRKNTSVWHRSGPARCLK